LYVISAFSRADIAAGCRCECEKDIHKLVVDEMIDSGRINGKLKKLPIFDFQAFKRG